MNNHKKPIPRLSVNIPHDLRKRLDQLPWGVIKPLVITILDETLTAIEKDPRVLGGILCNEIKLSDFSKHLTRDNDESTGRTTSDNDQS